MMNKKSISFVVGLFVWLLVSFAGQAQIHAIDVKWNGESLGFGQAAYLEGGVAWAPVREVLEATGATVTWNHSKKTVTAIKGKTQLVLQVGSKQALVNGKSVKLPAAVKLEDGRSFAPIRVMGETFGVKIEWIGWEQAVYMTESGKTSVREAEELVRKELRIDGTSSKTVVEFDHMDEERYVVHVYHLVNHHTATQGWYLVELRTGKVTSMF